MCCNYCIILYVKYFYIAIKLVDNMNKHSYTIIMKTTKRSVQRAAKDQIIIGNLQNIDYETAIKDNTKALEVMARIYKILSDKTKLKIMVVLLEKCANVSEITQELKLSQSLVSHQLKVLRDEHLVLTKRNKNKIIYSLADEHVRELISVAFDHASEII